ncbi:hypothetical protein F5Y13DRAFT_44794 [Hypoxylon sp. FL1857]|nr:hypothetical protein F5Y13DRAFT_44794 [Hypoxylon sp. FL1857]
MGGIEKIIWRLTRPVMLFLWIWLCAKLSYLDRIWVFFIKDLDDWNRHNSASALALLVMHSWVTPVRNSRHQRHQRHGQIWCHVPLTGMKRFS